MGFSLSLFLLFFLPQLIVLLYFTKVNIKNTGINRGTHNTVSAVQGVCFGIILVISVPFVYFKEYTWGGGNTLATDIILHYALSFFASHGTFILTVEKPQYSEFFHHLLCAFAVLYSLITQTFGQDAIIVLFLGEISFTFYAKIVAKNMNWIQIEKWCYEIHIFLFSFIRTIIFPIYFYFFISQVTLPFLPLLIIVTFLLLGIYWSILISKKRLEQHLSSKELKKLFAQEN